MQLHAFYMVLHVSEWITWVLHINLHAWLHIPLHSSLHHITWQITCLLQDISKESSPHHARNPPTSRAPAPTLLRARSGRPPPRNPIARVCEGLFLAWALGRVPRRTVPRAWRGLPWRRTARRLRFPSRVCVRLAVMSLIESRQPKRFQVPSACIAYIYIYIIVS